MEVTSKYKRMIEENGLVSTTKYKRKIINLSDRHTNVDAELIRNDNLITVKFTSFDTQYSICVNNGEFMQLLKILETLKQEL